MTPNRARRRHFEVFREHTRLKHNVLHAYVQAWAAKLLHWGGAGNTVWFVDAFAGAGKDNEGNPGSPLIVGRISNDIREGRIKRPIDRDVRLRMLAIEQSSARFRKLERAVRDDLGDSHPDIELRRGVLPTYLERFLGYVREAPVLYFLDPYGLDGMDVALLPKIMAAPHSEIIALFSDEGALRLYGLSRVSEPDFASLKSKAQEIESLFGNEYTSSLIEDELQRLQRREQGYANREDAERILTTALGPRWRQSFKKVVRLDEVPRLAVDLYVAALRDAGAAHVTKFSVRDDRGRHKYYLVHATKSDDGVIAFKEALVAAQRNSGRLSDDLSLLQDPTDAIARLQVRFGGNDVPWASKRGDSVRRFLLVNTPLLSNELQPVKRELEARGLRLPGRTLMYRFPERT